MTINKKYTISVLALMMVPMLSQAMTFANHTEHKIRAGHVYFTNVTPYTVELVSIKDAPGNYPPKCNAYSGPKAGSMIPPFGNLSATLVGHFTYGDHDGKYLSGCQLNFKILDYNYAGDEQLFSITISRDQWCGEQYGPIDVRDCAIADTAKQTFMIYRAYFGTPYTSSTIQGAGGNPTAAGSLYLTGGITDSTTTYHSKSISDSSWGDYFAVTLGVSLQGFNCNPDSNGNPIKDWVETIYNPIGQLDDKGNSTNITGCANAMSEL